MTANSDVGAAAWTAFRSALVIACGLSLVLTFYQIAEGQQLARSEQRTLVTLGSAPSSPPPPREVQPPPERYPLYIFPPRSHHFEGGPLTDQPDVWPVVVHKVTPEYTDVAKKARIAGIVIVEAIIDAEGKVRAARIAKPLPFGLDQKAIEAVRQWTFKPGTVDGKPVPVIMRLAVRFAPDGK